MSKQQIQDWILQTLEKESVIPDTITLTLNDKAVNQLDILSVLNALKSRAMVDYQPLVTEKWILTTEGLSISETGSHEARVYHAIPKGTDGISIADLTVFLFH
jgi:phenylalanyl-tRNA synthetase alpha chain